MRLRMLGILISMLAGGSASAEAPAPAAPPPAVAWDDSHMQSRHQEAPPTKRPLITGESGYGALASGSSKSSEQVPESIEHASQRQWTQGPLTGTTSAASSGTSFSSPEPGSVHRSGQSGSRGSQLRGGSVHNGSRGR